MSSRPTIPRPSFVLVTDPWRVEGRPHDGHEGLDDIARDAVLGGVNLVQLRAKRSERLGRVTLATPQLIELGLHIRDAITDRALFFVNGDVAATRALRADGIHLPSYGPTIRDVRGDLGDGILISLAVHSKERALAGAEEGADIIQLGAIFETATHPGVAPLGLDALREVCAVVNIPVIAIGGITADNAAECTAAGAAGVAVISAIHDAPNPREAAATLRAAIGPLTADR